MAAYVDLSEQQDHFRKAFSLAALALCLLISGAVGFPTIAWYRRTKEKQQADRRIRFLAHHDMLTGLSNRAQLIEKLENALALLPLRSGCLAVHFIDLDHFKDVNDTLGHDGGDFLLKTIAERLRAVARADDVVARLGGDEFVVVQTRVSGRDEVEEFRAKPHLRCNRANDPQGTGDCRYRQCRRCVGTCGRNQSGAALEKRGSGAVQGQG